MREDQRTERPVPYRLLADVLWRRRDEPSFEICRFMELPEFYSVQGSVLSTSDGAPFQIQYVVQCDLSWRTRAVFVSTTRGRISRRLELHREVTGVWMRGGHELADLAGLTDIDLSVTPSTNTLPLRRLTLAVGESAEATAVWIRFPDLDIERLPQRYTRLSERVYSYESGGGSFTADLEVDSEGVVVRYGDLWERVVPDSAHSQPTP